MIIAELVATLGLLPREAEWAKGDKLIEGMHKALEVFLGVEALKGVYEMISGVVELGRSLDETAQKTGLSVEGLQFLGFAAKQNSNTMEDMAHAVEKYSRGLDEANTKGSGPAAEALTRLGINFHDAGFKANSLDEQVQLISDKLAKLPDGTKKTALAMDLFGRSGANIIPTLNDLGKHGDELRIKFRELGGGLSGAQVKELDEFGREVDQAKFSLGALKNQVVAEMVPALREMIQGFLQWIKTNKEMIASTLTSVLHGLIEVVKLVGQAFLVATDILQFFADHADLTKVVLLALGLIIAAFAIDAAISWLIAFWPLVLAVAIIAAVTYAVIKLWDWIKNGDDLAARTIRRIIGAFKSLVDNVVEVAKDIRDGLEAAFNWVANLPVIKQIIGALEDIKEVGEWFGKKAKAAVETTRSVIDNTSNKVEAGTKLDENSRGRFGGLEQFVLHPELAANPSAAFGDRPSGAGSVSITHGDINLTINGADMSKDDLKAAAKEAISESRTEEYQSAWDALKGGHS